MDALHDRLVDAARAHLWQPFSQPRDLTSPDEPVLLARGEGVWLWDDRGRKYLDAIGALESMAIGHGNQELPEVAARQMRELAFIDVFRYVSRPAIELAERLAHLAPAGLNRVHYTPGGSEAVEVAIKLAFQYHWLRGKPAKRKVLTRQGAYHGVTFGAMNCDGRYWSTRTDIYLGAERFGRVAMGPARGEGWGRGAAVTAGAEEFEDLLLAEGPDTVAAIIVDPVATASGVAAPPAEDLRKLRRLCDAHDVLLIVDEVIAAFGRTGSMFTSTAYGVVPDFVPISKALSSGYVPIGATLIHEAIADTFDRHGPGDGRFTHGHTFGGHPVACAVALANLGIIEREGLPERALARGASLVRRLEPLRSHPAVGDVRGVGLIQGVELFADDGPARDAAIAAFGSVPAACAWFRKALRDEGAIALFLHPGNVLLLAPPLVIEEEELDVLVASIARTLDRLDERLAAA